MFIVDSDLPRPYIHARLARVKSQPVNPWTDKSASMNFLETRGV